MSRYHTCSALVLADTETYYRQDNEYAWIKIAYEYLPLSANLYILFTQQQLNLCYRKGVTYYCKNMYFIRHPSKHTRVSNLL